MHVFGNAVRIQELVNLCREKNIRVVEDATESLGTFYLDDERESVHTGTVGDIGCFSFNGNKIITTGGGGMLITASPSMAREARYLTTQAKDDEVRYLHHEIGYNFRLTNIQAAIGVAQLERLPEFLKIKRNNFISYKEKIDRIGGLSLSAGPAYARNNNWMYALRIDDKRYGKSREELMAHLAAQGIQTRPVWHLNHLQRPYLNCQQYRIEKAYRLHAMTLNIPCSVGLSEKDILYVVEKLNNA
ncbi:MAG: DegT/DnrJ/EryC1/StrS family aminotransferase [Desulfatitalea sp.]